MDSRVKSQTHYLYFIGVLKKWDILKKFGEYVSQVTMYPYTMLAESHYLQSPVDKLNKCTSIQKRKLI